MIGEPDHRKLISEGRDGSLAMHPHRLFGRDCDFTEKPTAIGGSW